MVNVSLTRCEYTKFKINVYMYTERCNKLALKVELKHKWKHQFASVGGYWIFAMVYTAHNELFQVMLR